MNLKRLRSYAISQAFFSPTTLKVALEKFGFVQADPIRAPARAQDLILRHRVENYKSGDLEKHYPKLNLEEDVLYAYGFMPRTTWELLHPRPVTKLSQLEKQVLEIVADLGTMHPKVLEKKLGKQRVVNVWGGFSQATTQTLEALHYRGLLRVAKRDNGIRVYESAVPLQKELSAEERLRKLTMTIAQILAPIPQKTLQSQIARFKRLGNPKVMLEALLKSRELQQEKLGGINYLWPNSAKPQVELPRTVKFLAPFDPLVWDRKRFEHLWGWAYRFEAYTPKAKRVRGYYAMPLLWGEEIIGWANVSSARKDLHVELGYVQQEPKDKAFHRALELEIENMKLFLQKETI